MPIVLRDYQRAAIDGVLRYFDRHGGSPLVVLPTGSGKSLVAAVLIQEAIRDYPSTRVLLLTHVKELIEQDHRALLSVWPDAPAGVYSAGLKRRDKRAPILFAGIQSVHRRATEFDPFDLVIIDEAHLIPREGDGMYLRFLADARLCNPLLKCIGLTATPYRMDSGLLTQGRNRIFDGIAYSAPLPKLIASGHLAPLRTKGSTIAPDLDGVHVRQGDYVVAELEERMAHVTEAALADAMRLAHDRRSILVFCVSVGHAEYACSVLRALGVGAECIHGGTPAAERDAVIGRFRSGETRALTNCMVLTTGFDAPGVDCLVFLRPTKSAGLFVQMAGRGMRLAPGKADCLCLDYANLVATHGPIDQIGARAVRQSGGGRAPVKVCPECQEHVHAGCLTCPACGYEWPPREIEHETQASTAEILSTGAVVEIDRAQYGVHTKPGMPPSLRVDYYQGARRVASEWVCLEHAGRARERAVDWWARRTEKPVPRTVAGALALADALLVPSAVVVSREGKYDRVTGYAFEG
jgi:DNA repair protein RadD